MARKTNGKALYFCYGSWRSRVAGQFESLPRRVREGAEVTVTDHGKAVARLIALNEPRTIDRLVDDGLVIPAPTAKTRLSHTKVKSKGTVSDLVAEQRQ